MARFIHDYTDRWPASGMLYAGEHAYGVFLVVTAFAGHLPDDPPKVHWTIVNDQGELLSFGDDPGNRDVQSLILYQLLKALGYDGV